MSHLLVELLQLWVNLTDLYAELTIPHSVSDANWPDSVQGNTPFSDVLILLWKYTHRRCLQAPHA